MKPIYACLFYLCGVVAVSFAGAASADGLTVGIGVGERDGVHHNWLEQNRFLYKVVEPGIPDSGRPDSELPYQLRQDQSSWKGNMGNDDINLPDSGVNRSMTPSADMPNSVHGGGPNPLPTFPDARPGPEGDPAVRDLGGSGLSEPSAPPGSLGR